MRPDPTPANAFTYLHLAADKPQALALMQSKARCIAYETVTEAQGGLPLCGPCRKWQAGFRFMWG